MKNVQTEVLNMFSKPVLSFVLASGSLLAACHSPQLINTSLPQSVNYESRSLPSERTMASQPTTAASVDTSKSTQHFKVSADFGPESASNVADFTQNVSDFADSNVNELWVQAANGGVKERLLQITAFGSHMINPNLNDLKENQGQKPLIVNGDIAIGILGTDNFLVPYPISSSSQAELNFLKNKPLQEVKFIWDTNANTLRTIYLRTNNGELREINGPFNMMDTGYASSKAEQRPLLQQLLESTTPFNQVGQKEFIASQNNSTNTTTLGGGTQTIGNTSFIGGGSQNTGNTIFIGGGSQNTENTSLIGGGSQNLGCNNQNTGSVQNLGCGQNMGTIQYLNSSSVSIN